MEDPKDVWDTILNDEDEKANECQRMLLYTQASFLARYLDEQKIATHNTQHALWCDPAIVNDAPLPLVLWHLVVMYVTNGCVFLPVEVVQFRCCNRRHFSLARLVTCISPLSRSNDSTLEPTFDDRLQAIQPPSTKQPPTSTPPSASASTSAPAPPLFMCVLQEWPNVIAFPFSNNDQRWIHVVLSDCHIGDDDKFQDNPDDQDRLRTGSTCAFATPVTHYLPNWNEHLKEFDVFVDPLVPISLSFSLPIGAGPVSADRPIELSAPNRLGYIDADMPSTDVSHTHPRRADVSHTHPQHINAAMQSTYVCHPHRQSNVVDCRCVGYVRWRVHSHMAIAWPILCKVLDANQTILMLIFDCLSDFEIAPHVMPSRPSTNSGAGYDYSLVSDINTCPRKQSCIHTVDGWMRVAKDVGLFPDTLPPSMLIAMGLMPEDDDDDS